MEKLSESEILRQENNGSGSRQRNENDELLDNTNRFLSASYQQQQSSSYHHTQASYLTSHPLYPQFSAHSSAMYNQWHQLQSSLPSTSSDIWKSSSNAVSCVAPHRSDYSSPDISMASVNVAKKESMLEALSLPRLEKNSLKLENSSGDITSSPHLEIKEEILSESFSTSSASDMITSKPSLQNNSSSLFTNIVIDENASKTSFSETHSSVKNNGEKLDKSSTVHSYEMQENQQKIQKERKDSIKLCLVCHSSVNCTEHHDWRHVENDFTSTSFTQLSDVVDKIMREAKKTIVVRKTSIVCIQCFNLLDKVDELEEQLKVRIFLFMYGLILWNKHL